MSAADRLLGRALLDARLRRPYYGAALAALVPVERPGLGTLGVDRHWRLYYDPDVVSRASATERVTLVLHELGHLRLRHHVRAEALGVTAATAPTANAAQDAAINSQEFCEAEEPGVPHPSTVTVPGPGVTPDALGVPAGERWEVTYRRLLDRSTAPDDSGATDSAPDDSGATGQSPAGDSGDDASEGAPGGTSGSGTSDGSTAPTAGAEGDEAASASADPSGAGSPGPQGSPAAPADGRESSTETGDDAGGQCPSASSSSSSAGSPEDDPPPGDDAGGQCPSASSDIGSAGQGGDSDGSQEPYGAGVCGGGSGCDGIRRPWEADAPDQPGAPPGVLPAEQDRIWREVAEAVRQDAQRGRGTVPGTLREWADGLLDALAERSRVDWRRELAAVVRRVTESAAGCRDYDRRRLDTRRYARQTGTREWIDALVEPEVTLAIVRDTSESMGTEESVAAVREIDEILRRASSARGARVLDVDTEVHDSRVARRARDIRATSGGGGTDMRRGIEAALRLRPRPHAVVVITDGDTPWPDTPTSVPLVVALVRAPYHSSPDWTLTVDAR